MPKKDIDLLKDPVEGALLPERSVEPVRNLLPLRGDIFENLMRVCRGIERLETQQVKWVKERIETGYERTRLVNAHLIQIEGLPPFPSMEVALESALMQLTHEQLEFMRKEGRSPFKFQLKLVSPPNDFDSLRRLVDGQPRRMHTPGSRGGELTWGSQAPLCIDLDVLKHLAKQPLVSSGHEWRWSFYQGDQIIEDATREPWDDASLPTEERLQRFKSEWAKAGVHGTDRFAWTTAMADALEQGKPLDIRFVDDRMDTEKFILERNTVLDEEGVFEDNGTHVCIIGCFSSIGREPGLTIDFATGQRPHHEFRAEVDGHMDF